MKKLKKVFNIIYFILFGAIIVGALIMFGVEIGTDNLQYYIMFLIVITFILFWLLLLKTDISMLNNKIEITETKLEMTELKLKMKINENKIDVNKDFIKIIEFIEGSRELSKENAKLLLKFGKILVDKINKKVA